MGKKFASYTGTSQVGANLKSTQWSTVTDTTEFIIDKLTFVADSSTKIKINNSTYWQDLYYDTNDSKYKISFNSGDIKINSFETDTAVVYYVAFLY